MEERHIIPCSETIRVGKKHTDITQEITARSLTDILQEKKLTLFASYKQMRSVSMS